MIPSKLGLFFTIIIILGNNVRGENILFFWGMSGYSHRIAIWPLVEALASNGHNVTFFSPHPSKTPALHSHPNVTDFAPTDLLVGIGMTFHPAEIRMKEGVKGAEALWSTYLDGGVRLCRSITTNEGIVRWINSSSYDLIFINALFNDCGLGLAWKYNAKTILYGSSSPFPWWGENYGLPDENYPEFRYHLPLNMTFSQQVWNAVQPLYWKLYRSYYYIPLLENIVRPGLQIEDMPPLEEMDRRTSLILFNSHFSEEYPRSFPPWIVPVGGMHCKKETKPLPDTIQKFTEKWEDGFIYFSFGTYMKLPLLPQTHQDAIFGAIRKFPNIGFILKWNGGDVPKALPANVMTAEWMDQQAILAHPKVRAFISHGGLLGTQEAVYHGVPMIVFPIFAEQDYNAGRIHAAERGIMLEISELTQDQLVNSIREILTNKKYRENMKKTSKVFKDRPQSPVETALYWVEYVLRHKDTHPLKPNSILEKSFLEKRMLHVWGFLLCLILIVVGSIYYVLKLIIVKIVSIILGKGLMKSPKVKKS